jgi:transcription-repair coupling factor (superfamily II helicase)
VEMKIVGQELRLPKITFKNERLFLRFPATDDDPWFYEHCFQDMLSRLGNLDHRYVLKESRTGSLRAIIQDVPNLLAARTLVMGLSEPVQPSSRPGM